MSHPHPLSAPAIGSADRRLHASEYHFPQELVFWTLRRMDAYALGVRWPGEVHSARVNTATGEQELEDHRTMVRRADTLLE